MYHWITLPFLLFFLSCGNLRIEQTAFEAPKPIAPATGSKPKNIILIIGDGMSMSQVSAGIYWAGGLSKSAFGRFPVAGFHKSHSHDDLVTDSAAGATAFACGHKTDNGAIGVTPPDYKACPTILEDMDRQGYATGMVVTCSASHATPASFVAHQNMRAFSEHIAADFLSVELDCFIGGGEEYFTSERSDGENLEAQLKAKGYVIKSGESFKKLPLDGSAPFMLFTAQREPETAKEGRRYLAEASRTACDYLTKRSSKGFFLMIEGSQIDWALHANNPQWLRSEMYDFDKMLHKVLDFAASNGETLVIVTGDHECGGLALHENGSHKEVKQEFSSKYHTASLVPVFATGPGAELFSGIYDNTMIYYKMRSALGWSSAP